MATPSLLTTKSNAPVDFSKYVAGPVAMPPTMIPTPAKQPALTGAPLPAAPTPAATTAISQVSASNPVDITALTNAPTLNLPQLATPPIPDITSLPVVAESAEQARLRSEKEGLIGDITADTTKLGTQAARKGELEIGAGVPALNSQLNELNTQIRQLQADAAGATEKSENRLAATFAIRGEQAQIERQRAVRAMGLSAAAQAIQGNIALANDQVQRALDAEFGGLQAAIDNKKFLLTLNMDSFNAEEKKRADAQNALLDKQKQEIADAKDVRSKVYDVLIAAAQNGADNVTLNKIAGAKTVEDAITLAGPNLKKTPDTQIVSAGGRQLLINTATGEVIHDLGESDAALKLAADAASAAGSSADPGLMLAYAQQYASNGSIPSGLPKGTFGIVAQIAREMPKPDGTLVSNATGIAPSNMSHTQVDGVTALYDLQKKLDDANTLFDSYQHGVLAGVKNSLIPSTGSQQYNALRSEIVDLLARARTGAAITAFEEQSYAKKLPGNFNKPLFVFGAAGGDQIDSLKSSLAGKLESALKINNASIYGYSTINIAGHDYVVGSIVTNEAGQSGRINPDGTITLVQ